MYERYVLDWEWKNYLGCLWLPALAITISFSQRLNGAGFEQHVVQLIALAVVLGVFLAFGLIDLSRYRWNWRRALIWLWLPGGLALMIIATVLRMSGVLTIAATGVVIGACWLFSRSGKHLDG